MNESQIREATLLIVDDQADSVELLRQLLARAGYTHIHATTDSRKAFAMYEDVHPDLMILDLHMPPPSGVEILEQLACRRSSEELGSPVLVLTADVTPLTRLKALSMGAKDFLTKPVDHVDLLMRVRNLVETRLLERSLHAVSRVSAASSDVASTQDVSEDVLAVLSRVLEHHDARLGERASRVSRLAGSIATALGQPGDFAKQVEQVARIFDLGMLAVPESIRTKTGLLTRSEQQLWRKHTTVPELILGDHRGILDLARQVACSHHERWDGEGYPNGLKGEAIPLAARVVAVAEGYDSLLQSGASPEQAGEEICRQAGFAFDPEITTALVQAVGRRCVVG